MLRKLYRVFRFCTEGIFAYSYDACIYLIYSATVSREGQERVFGRVMVLVHALEKGLAMPEPKKGFGKAKIVELKQWRKKVDRLPDSKDRTFLLEQIDQVLRDMNNFNHDSFKSARFSTFPKIDPDQFDEFVASRVSSRIWTGQPVDELAIKRAQAAAGHAPSVCNRQPVRSKYISQGDVIKEILSIQGGAKGFGDNAGGLIAVYSDVGAYWHAHERNQVWIDGGLYAQTLLLALFANGISNCPLNMCLRPTDEKKVRNLFCLPRNVRLIMLVAVGREHALDNRVARSDRISL